MLEFEMQEITAEYILKLEQLDGELKRLYRALRSLKTIIEVQYGSYSVQLERFNGMDEWEGTVYDEFCRVYHEDYISSYKRYVDSIDALITDIEAVYQNKEAEKLYVQEMMQRELVQLMQKYESYGQVEDI